MADTCQHWTSETGYAQASLYAACPWCEIERQKQELSLAEEGLANYAQQNARLKCDLQELTCGDVRYMQAITEARVILEPLADCDPAVRAWLKRHAEPQSDKP